MAYASRALTPAESKYAQIEKELLAIVFACEIFEAYIFGRDLVNVETDHNPLEAIVLKPLYAAPQRLQRMLLRLQKFNLRVKYQKGTQMFLSDTLSRAHLPEVEKCFSVHDLEMVDHKATLAISGARWHQIKHASADDPVLQELRSVIQLGCPDCKKELPQLRAAACKYQISPDSSKKSTSILFHEKNPYIELFSKIEFKRLSEFHNVLAIYHCFNTPNCQYSI